MKQRCSQLRAAANSLKVVALRLCTEITSMQQVGLRNQPLLLSVACIASQSNHFETSMHKRHMYVRAPVHHLAQNDAQPGAVTLGLLLLALRRHQGPCCHPACHKQFSQAVCLISIEVVPSIVPTIICACQSGNSMQKKGPMYKDWGPQELCLYPCTNTGAYKGFVLEKTKLPKMSKCCCCR